MSFSRLLEQLNKGIEYSAKKRESIDSAIVVKSAPQKKMTDVLLDLILAYDEGSPQQVAQAAVTKIVEENFQAFSKMSAEDARIFFDEIKANPLLGKKNFLDVDKMPDNEKLKYWQAHQLAFQCIKIIIDNSTFELSDLYRNKLAENKNPQPFSVNDKTDLKELLQLVSDTEQCTETYFSRPFERFNIEYPMEVVERHRDEGKTLKFCSTLNVSNLVSNVLPLEECMRDVNEYFRDIANSLRMTMANLSLNSIQDQLINPKPGEAPHPDEAVVDNLSFISNEVDNIFISSELTSLKEKMLLLKILSKTIILINTPKEDLIKVSQEYMQLADELKTQLAKEKPGRFDNLLASMQMILGLVLQIVLHIERTAFNVISSRRNKGLFEDPNFLLKKGMANKAKVNKRKHRYSLLKNMGELNDNKTKSEADKDKDPTLRKFIIRR